MTVSAASRSGIDAGQRSGQRPSVRPVRRLLGTAFATLSVALVVGCSGPGTDSARSDSGSSAGGEAGVGEPAVAPGDPAADEDRQVVTTGDAVLTVDDPAGGAQRISELVETAGGRVDQRSEHTPSGPKDVEGASADLVVRVPSDALTGLLADLEDVGKVESVSVSRSDVTSTAVDLDARISALTTSVSRLQSLMDDATSTQALLDAENALSERQADLESLQSQRALLADQVELSTLSLHLQQPGVAPAGGPDGFGDGLGTGWRALLAAGGTLLVVLGVLLPWAAVTALILAAVLVPVRLSRRRAEARAAIPPPPAA
jgi:hypothetical protein